MRHIITITAAIAMAFAMHAAAQTDTNTEYAGTVKAEGVTTGVANGRLHLDMTLRLDSLGLPSNRRIVYTPLLVGEAEGDTAVFTPVMVNGRRQHISYERDAKGFAGYEVRRLERKPQSVDYSASVEYEPWMDNAILYLTDDLCGCGDILDRGRSELAVIDNRPAPAPVFEPLTCYVMPEAEAVKARSESGRAYVDFRVNRTEINPDYRRNTVELARIISTVDLVKNDSNVTITAIDIHGYASPEGPYANNERLASGRAKALADYVARLRDFNPSIFNVRSTPEDWDGLRRIVADSLSLDDSAGLLAIIDDTTLAPDARDRRLKERYPAQYGYLLENVYPALRHSDYTVHYTVRAFNLEEARKVFATRPGQLSLQELFLVARSYPAGSEEFNRVFDVAVHLYPDNPTANLNAAINAVNRRDIESAERYIAPVPESPESDEVRRAIITLREINKQSY